MPLKAMSRKLSDDGLYFKVFFKMRGYLACRSAREGIFAFVISV